MRFIPILALLSTVYASPIKRATVRRGNTITASDITQIDPSTSSCANAPAAGECRTAAQAAPYVAISFTNFGIMSFGEQAAMVALMLYETGGFKYAQNHYPGVPGQGTRNMQSPAYNLKYADWLATVCLNCGMTSSEVQTAQAQGPVAVLGLVNSDEWSFGSAAWFLATQCDSSVRQALATGSQEGWESYLQCVGASDDADRDTLWNKAIALKAW